MRLQIVLACVLGLLLVAAGAAAGHATGPDPIALDHQSRLTTALLFGFVHVLASMAGPALRLRGVLATAASWVFIAGVVLFSTVLLGRLLTADASGASPFDSVVMAVPLGGLAFMAGWVLLGVSVLTQKRETETGA